MVNRSSLHLLQEFNAMPSSSRVESLACIPSVYHIIQFEYSKSSVLPQQLLNVLQWIASRTNQVLLQLLKYSAPPEDVTAHDVDGGWEKVSLDICLFDNEN
jgi:hypothetical protein